MALRRSPPGRKPSAPKIDRYASYSLLSLDGLFLYLHGAMISESYPDADGEMCARVRRLLGPDVPVMTTPDVHANLSQAMVQHTLKRSGQIFGEVPSPNWI